MPVLQAADDTSRAGRHVGAELLAVLEAGLCQGHVEADVARGVLHDLDHPRSARRRLDLLPANPCMLVTMECEQPEKQQALCAGPLEKSL